MAIIMRGDIVKAKLNDGCSDTLKGLHPFLIISCYKACAFGNYVQVIPISSTDNGFPMHVQLGANCGLLHDSYAYCEQIITIQKQNIISKVAKITYEDMLIVRAKVMQQLGFAETTNNKDLQKLHELVADLNELDKFIISNPTCRSVIGERIQKLNYLKNFCVNHSINNLQDYYDYTSNKEGVTKC